MLDDASLGVMEGLHFQKCRGPARLVERFRLAEHQTFAAQSVDAGQFLEEMAVTVEIEGGQRPAIAARWLTLYVA